MAIPNLVLTGLMGTGKSTVGKLVATRLDREFIDTDEYIEHHFGPASDILNRANGDAAFRQIEESVAHKLAGRAGLVISSGGRFMINQVNIDAMKKSGDIICLLANLEELVDRLLTGNSSTFRPRFNKADSKIALMQQLQLEGEPFYSQFEQVQTSGRTAAEVAQTIDDWFRSRH